MMVAKWCNAENNEIGEEKQNKTPAEQRDIFRPELFYNYINLRLKNSQCTMKKVRRKKALIHLSPFLKPTPILLFLQ